MRRRDFITRLGAAVPVPALLSAGFAHAQQPAMPVIGFLDGRSPDGLADRLRRLRQGLKETGYIEGENVAIEYRWADNQLDRLPALAADLVHRRVAVIAAPGGPAAALAAKAATTTLPIVFVLNEDPVKRGLVASIARPGGNLTGVNFFTGELVAKRLELLRELVPAIARVAVLVNPENSANTATTLGDMRSAASAMKLQIQALHASTGQQIDAGSATIAREKPDAVFIGIDPFFNVRRQLVHLASHYRLPATYGNRDFAEAGGLMSYGSDIADAWRLAGTYVGRILKGAKPADLPVEQASKFELIINAQTARMLGLAVPPMLLARADEVIE